MRSSPRLHCLDDEAAVVAAVREAMARAAERAIAERGVFHVVLAGGTTPRALYSSAAALVTDWAAWRIWFGDERVAPPDDPQRNSRMAWETWFAHVPLPPGNFRPMPTELGLEAACAAYTAALAEVDAFDLVLLGLGEDGHTASLFPGHPLGYEAGAPPVLAVRDAPKPPPERLTLSADRLSRARQVLFLVVGENKRLALARWLEGEPIPAAFIRPPAGVDVYADRAACP